jgi:hypothetical protein
MNKLHVSPQMMFALSTVAIVLGAFGILFLDVATPLYVLCLLGGGVLLGAAITQRIYEM